MVKVTLLGVPHDANSSYLRGPAQAPPLIRRELFSDAYSLWSETGVDLGADVFADAGDLTFDEALDPWDVIAHGVEAAAAAGPLICLGGDHAVTYPILRGLRRRHGALTILHIDAHADIYHAYQDNPRSHASPFARIMEEGLADRLVQVGLRTVNDEHRAQFERFGVEAYDIRRLPDPASLRFETPVYISVDIDALDPAFAPGVSHREPGGLTTRQVIDYIQAVAQPVVGADVVEYNPTCDIAGQTALVAAKLVKEIAGMMVRSHQT
ncbi:arginase family protein [Phenylobacterium sp.]|uniref:arginase family protein n=1 Tax=Phenylobacterium sp. TaxID=1871053 RepID=UPI0028121387|nr:arginase family protein [Phenylobacterium sp.]